MSDKKSISAFYGWKMVAILFTIYLLNIAFPYYGGTVLNAYMAQDLALSRSSLGLGFSLFFVSFGLASPLVGMLVNKIGIRITLCVGGLLLAVGSLLMAFAISQAWHYYMIFGVLCAFGLSMGGAIPVQSGVTYWFKRQKPLAMSIVLCAAGIGGIISIPILNYVVHLFDDNWRAGWCVISFTSIIAALIALIWIKNKPEDLGQFPDGVDPADETDIGMSVAPKKKLAVHHTSESWTVTEALRSKASMIILVAAVAFTMVFNLCIAHGVVHLKDQGIEENIATMSVGILVFSSIIGRLLSGTLGNRIEPRFIWCAALLVMAAGTLILANATSNWQVHIYAFSIGLGFGTSYVSVSTMIGNYFGVESFAPILGILITITYLVGAGSPLLAGVIYDSLGDYSIAFGIVFVFALLGAVSIPFATPPKITQKIKL